VTKSDKMLIYTNQKSKQTRKQKVKQQQRWEQSQKAIGGTTLKFKSSFTPLKVQPISAIRPGADDYKKHSSVQTNLHNTYKKEIPVYTGQAMIGIGTLHKSNAVPIFSKDEAKEISRMRRG
jgi:hypothetical protein